MFSIPRPDVTTEWREIMAFWSRGKRQKRVVEPADAGQVQKSRKSVSFLGIMIQGFSHS